MRDNEGSLSSYDYDENSRLSSIYNGLGNKVFEAEYDKYHRATQQAIGNHLVTQDFNLSNRSAGLQVLPLLTNIILTLSIVLSSSKMGWVETFSLPMARALAQKSCHKQWT